MKARVTVMLKDGVLDPQGRAIGETLHQLGYGEVGEVRAGKVIELELAPGGAGDPRGRVEEMARRLLANGVIEAFQVEMLP